MDLPEIGTPFGPIIKHLKAADNIAAEHGLYGLQSVFTSIMGALYADLAEPEMKAIHNIAQSVNEANLKNQKNLHQ